MSKIRQVKTSLEQRVIWDGRGRLQPRAHPEGSASHMHGLVPRGWYLRRWWLDSHGLGCPSWRRRLGLHLLLDSVVVGDPSIHLGLGLCSPESRRVSAGRTQKPASPVRASRVMAQSWAVTRCHHRAPKVRPATQGPGSVCAVLHKVTKNSSTYTSQRTIAYPCPSSGPRGTARLQ